MMSPMIKTRLTRVAAVWMIVTAAATTAAAQTRPATSPPRPPRPFVEHGFVSIYAGAQSAADELSDRVSFDANAEAGTIEAAYPGRTGVLIDAAVGVRVRKQIGVALAVSRATRSGDVSVGAQVPHPFFDNRHRGVEGTAGGMSRTETAVHAQLYFDLRPRGPWRARLFAGPSYFDVEQELVTAVTTVETFPYDTAEFGSAATAKAKGTGIGFNAGLDVSRLFGRRMGIGALVRYARASVDLNAPGSRTVSTDGGGIEATAGLRFLF